MRYKTTEYYAAEWERTLVWNDPQVDVNWRIIDGRPLLLSSKDKQGKSLLECDLFD